MALTITNGGNGSDLQLGSGVYVTIPAYNLSNFSDSFEVAFYGKALNATTSFTIVGHSGSTNNPVIKIEPQNGNLIRIRNGAVERTATLGTLDFTNAEGFQLRVYVAGGSLQVRGQELTQTDLDNAAANANGLPTLDGNGNPTGGGTAQYQFVGSFNGAFPINRVFDGSADTNANYGTALAIEITSSTASPDVIYNFSRTSGTAVPEINGGTAGTLVGATKTYGPQYTFNENITFTSGLTGLTRVYIEDTQGNQFDLTGVTDTDADIPALAANLDACLLELGTLNVTDGVSTESEDIELTAPSGYETTTLDSLPPVELATNWTFGFDTAAAIGDQSFENSADITHNTNGSITWTPQALTYTYYTIDATDGVISEITKTFDEEGVLVGIPAESRTPPWKLAQYLRDNESLEGSTNDVIFKWLEGQGYTGALNDMWIQYWEAQGYTGSYSDKRYKWLKM